MNPFIRDALKSFLVKSPSRATRQRFLNHIKKTGFCPAVIIDVGVGYGTIDIYRAFPKAYLFLVEPLIEFTSAMQAILKRYPGEAVLAAAGNRDEEAKIYFDNNVQGATLLQNKNESRQVKVVRLDQICEKPGPYLIKIDVQGTEISVIEGMVGILDKTEVVILECAFFGFYEKQPTISDIFDCMYRLDFVPYDIFDPLFSPSEGTLVQVDVAFVKRNGPFQQNREYMMKSQHRRSQILHKIRKALGI